METNTMAQLAYRAFGNWNGWKTPQGKRIPNWEELSTNVKNAWTSAAETVAVQVRRETMAEGEFPE